MLGIRCWVEDFHFGFDMYTLLYLIYFWLYWVFVAARRFSVISESRGYSSCSVQAPPCSGFSCGAKALGHTVFSSCGISPGCRALGHSGFCICSTWAQYLGLTGLRERAQQLWSVGSWLCGMWNLPRPGIASVSPALAGRFLSTAPPGKSPG